jgi:hypothetical protein
VRRSRTAAEGIEALSAGEATGPLFGGTLSLLCASLVRHSLAPPKAASCFSRM